jgi:hypothetical protein
MLPVKKFVLAKPGLVAATRLQIKEFGSSGQDGSASGRGGGNDEDKRLRECEVESMDLRNKAFCSSRIDSTAPFH